MKRLISGVIIAFMFALCGSWTLWAEEKKTGSCFLDQAESGAVGVADSTCDSGMRWVVPEIATTPYYSTGTIALRVSGPREIGGVDSKGKPYLVMADGKRKPCSKRALIKVILASDLHVSYKTQALAYLGRPIDLRIYGETK